MSIVTNDRVAPRKVPNLVSIGVLRGVAALWVLLYHARGFYLRIPSCEWPVYEFNNPQNSAVFVLDQFLGFGWTGVPLFFVLSGFCVHAPNVGVDRLNIHVYLARRFLRIWPPFAFASLLGGAISLFMKVDSPLNTALNTCLHLVFWIWLFSPLDPTNHALNAVFWSVVVEVHLYLLYAFLFLSIRRFGLGRVCLLFVLIGFTYHIAVGFLATGVPSILAPHSFAIARFGEWLLGAWIAELVLNDKGANDFCKKPLFAVAGFVLILLFCFLSRMTPSPYTFELIASLGFSALIIFLVSRELAYRDQSKDHQKSGLLTRVGVLLGERCYSLYLLHYPCIATVGFLAMRFQVVNGHDYNSIAGTPIWLAVTLSGVLFAFIVTEIAYRLIELPSHHLARVASKRLAAASRN